MIVFTTAGLLGLAWKIAIAGSLGFSINSLSGNRFGNLFFGKDGKREFKSDYDYEMDEYKKSKNQHTRTRSRGNFFNFNSSFLSSSFLSSIM